MNFNLRKNKSGKRITLLIVAVVAGYLLWPVQPQFPDDYSRVVTDKNGQILRVTCASDGQIRLKPEDNAHIPEKYRIAVTTIEDKRYFYHPGVDPLAFVSAFVQNISKDQKKRGASTITMQVIRLSHPRPRTYSSKIIECFAAIRLDLHKSKKEILKLYATHAPMGGNIAGIRSASLYYFGKQLNEMTWAEAALFSVLPNNPSMINLKKERPRLKEKRDRVLAILCKKGHIDSVSYALAIDEPLPPAKCSLPFEASHFSELALRSSDQKNIYTTLDNRIQRDVHSIVNRYSKKYKEYGVDNIAVLVINTRTNEVTAYAGSQDYNDTSNCGRVDGVMALRSSGSLLKPLLAAKAMDRGPWVLESKILDVPTYYGTFAPLNANKDFQGVVSLEDMLTHSLNIPAVRLLYDYGIDDFYSDLKEMGVTSLFRSAQGYGLSLVLGGAEVSLWDMCKVYSGLGNQGGIRPIIFLKDPKNKKTEDSLRLCSSGASWLVLSALSKLNRPDVESFWQLFSDQVPVAWKTGTSYGQKDAWAVGVNRQWTIGVWVGNFTGQGNTFLGGAVSAGPVLFSLFRQLTDLDSEFWFEKPEFDLKPVTVCASTGYLPNSSCPDTVNTYKPSGAWKTEQCQWHQKVITDKKSGLEVCSRCWTGVDRKDTVLLLYPSAATEIMRRKGMKADLMPSHNPICTAVKAKVNRITIEYPVDGISIFIPRDMKGEYQRVVAKASCGTGSSLFWYLDGNYLGKTVDIHTMAVSCKTGKHVLSVFDNEDGLQRTSFDVVRK